VPTVTVVDRTAPHDHSADGWVLQDRKPHWAFPIAAAAAVVVGTVYTAVNNPNDRSNHAFPICPLKFITHLDCPACGSLRATHALAHGRIGEAFDHNVVFTALVPLLIVGWGLWLARSLGYRGLQITLPRWLPSVAVIGFILFGVVRNLPIPGHAFLFSG
jgi:hypothetical protein